MFRSFKLAIWLLLSQTIFGGAVTYEDALSNMLVGNITVNHGQSALIEYYKPGPFETSLDASLVSLNNGRVVSDAIELYNYAIAGEKWGDAAFFKMFISYNGQAHDYLTSEDVANDFSTLAAGNQTVIDTWIKTTTNEKLAELYAHLPEFGSSS
ncbi:LAMI_0A08108g1_1 [Lachancea mirantina]|uniref:LAMI_0A08108g1_1 n=1 Tax=Lachancea mirantina TaxID=1230905 RepID=A0A1G4IRM0_9SACH|nr:LAMI_0A08108g1_1 [Lachancea mirantina]